MDIVEKLEELIGSFGTMEQKRGGFEILIKDGEKFPMYEICKMLITSDFDVWVIESGKSQLQIVSNPKRVKR